VLIGGCQSRIAGATSRMTPGLSTASNGVELAQMRWSFPPPKPGGKPVLNFRSDGRLISATAFFEFTGAKSPKTKHRFTMAGQPFFCIAGIWRDGAAGEPPDFTMLTTAPGPDVEPYYDRQVAVLQPADWPAWINLTRPEKDILQPLPPGALTVETVRQDKAWFRRVERRPRPASSSPRRARSTKLRRICRRRTRPTGSAGDGWALIATAALTLGGRRSRMRHLRR
jgi:putative SOS response-associated peptidase YedK